MERTPWKLRIGTYTTEATSCNLHNGRYAVDITPWKLPHGTYTMEDTS